LYQIEQNPGVSAGDIRQFVNRRLLGDKKLIEFTDDLITGVRDNQPQIDAMIKAVAENWRLDRMAAIDRNILRLGAYEVVFRSEVPAKVAINEALELAKRYSTAQSSRFVNGILDRVFQLHVEPKPEGDCPAVDAPAAARPVVDAPAADRPVVDGPAADRPVVDAPAADRSAGDETPSPPAADGPQPAPGGPEPG